MFLPVPGSSLDKAACSETWASGDEWPWGLFPHFFPHLNQLVFTSCPVRGQLWPCCCLSPWHPKLPSPTLKQMPITAVFLDSLAAVETGFQTGHLGISTSVCFTKKWQTWPYYLERSGWHSMWDFKEKPNKASVLGHSNYHLSFFSSYVRRKGLPLESSPKNRP